MVVVCGKYTILTLCIYGCVAPTTSIESQFRSPSSARRYVMCAMCAYTQPHVCIRVHVSVYIYKCLCTCGVPDGCPVLPTYFPLFTESDGVYECSSTVWLLSLVL